MKELYEKYEGYILFTIMSVWCILGGLFGVPFYIVLIGAAIPTLISLIKIAQGIQDIVMENMSIYMNYKGMFR